MRLFDTHCHFERADPTGIASVLRRAKAAGVERVMAVGGGTALNLAVETAVQVFAGNAESQDMPLVCAAVGYDRDQVSATRPDIPDDLPLAAWGEIGLDYHYSRETRDAQMKLFASGLEEARRRDLPVIVHTREADDDTLALLREIPSRGVIHCYTGTLENAKAFLDLGFCISFAGVVTFKPARGVREVAAFVPDDRLLVETDSPYLAPEPLRGTVNEPANVALTCEFVARLRGADPETFAELTFANACRVFGL